MNICLASSNGHKDMVRLLLDNKAEVVTKNNSGYTALLEGLIYKLKLCGFCIN